jgi:ppGpp synthetase/RelA/SpoT-type nucleotidyltranferase
MIISEKSLTKGIEVDVSNAESKLPNRAIRYNHSAGTNKYELYNYSNNQVDYTFRDLEDLVKLTNRLFQRDDTYVSEVSYHTDSYNKGGLFVGKSHAEGGIPVKVKSTGQDIEVEGGEIIINKKNSASTKSNKFNGKEMSNCEVLSEINEQGGNGVKIDCDTIEGKKYKHERGGRTQEFDEIFEDYFETGGKIKYIYPENSLGIEKKDLPQIRTKDKPLFVKYLADKYGRSMTMEDDVLASTLSPVQNKINPEQIKVIADSGGLRQGKPITISNDGYVIDGHHRWYYASQHGLSLPVLKINLPAKRVIFESFMSGLAEKEDIDSVRGAYAEGGKVSREFARSQIPMSLYKSFFADTDGDGVPNVDDVEPFNKNNKERLEEVSLRDEMKQIIEYRNDFEKVREEVVDDLDDIVSECDGKGECGILSRTKTPYSIINKLRRRSLTNVKDLDKLDKLAKEKLKTKELTGLDLYKGLTDVVGTMVVTPDKKNADKIRDAIKSGRVGEVLEFEDFYANDNDGYRAYHFLIAVNKNGIKFPVEIQVKTKRVKKIGDFAHTAYKTGNLDASGFDRLNKLALQADKGNPKKAREFDEIIRNEKKVMEIISKKKKARGGISDYLGGEFTPQNPKEKEVMQIIPITTRLTSDELAKIDFDFLHSNINQAPIQRDDSIADDKQITAYFRFYNDFGTNLFVTDYNPNARSSDRQGNVIPVGEVGGYYIEPDSEENSSMKSFKLPDLFQDYGDEMVNFKLDYDFTPQTINGGLAIAGLKRFQSMDVKPIGKSFTDFDIDTIINTPYKSRVERNSAIINMVGYLGINSNDYDVDAKNFIATYSCASFRSVRSPKLYKVMAGMVYQDIANRNIEINDCITFGDCAGALCSNFDEKLDILSIDADKTSKNIASILNDEKTREFMTEKDLEINKPDSQRDSAIIINDNMLTINQQFSYVKPNGIIVALVFVNDFEDYFSLQSRRDDFLEKYKLLNKYRISTENILLHIQKIKN